MISFVFNEIFYKPLLNILIFFTDILPGNSLGLSIILITILVRFIIFPFTHKMMRTQSALKDLEPQIKKIKEDNKGKKEEEAKALMDLYKQHGISPFSGFFMLLIQLPLLISLYKIFMNNVALNLPEGLYSFVHYPPAVNGIFLGIDLSVPNVALAALAGVSQFFQARLASGKSKKEKNKKGPQDFQSIMKTQMVFVFPVMIFFIGLKFSAALALYWTVMNLFAIVHETIVKKRFQQTRK
ncbi:YidC/Oxa1 family membrane protein insertase [Patescibacteria group bacterium]